MVAQSIVGRLILFGFAWAVAFHFINGIRHLAWDIGYGFKVPTALADKLCDLRSFDSRRDCDLCLRLPSGGTAMSDRTPFSRVQGLGAAHSGTEHFWRERATSVALLPLTAWFVYAAVHMVGQPYANALHFSA